MTESAIPTELRRLIEDWTRTCPPGDERIAFIACHPEGTDKLSITLAVSSTTNTMASLFADLFKEADLRTAAILALIGGPND